MKIFGRGKNTEVTASDDDLDVAVDDDAAFDEAGESSLTASPRSLGTPRGGNKKVILLLFVLLLAGGGFAGMMMMGGGDAPPPIAVDTIARVSTDPNAPAGMPVDPNAPPADMAAMPPTGTDPALVQAATDNGMPPMPEMPPMPSPVADGAMPPADPLAAVAPIDPLAAVAPVDPNAPIDPNAPVVAAPDAAAPIDPNAPIAPATDVAAVDPLSPITPAVDALDAEGDVAADGLLETPTMPTAMPDPVAPVADITAQAPVIPAAPAAVATPPVTTTPAPAAPVAANTAEQALVDNADMVAAETSLQPAGRTPEEIAQLWASLPVEEAMIRPLPKQYLTVKKEKSAESIDSRLATARRALNDGRTPAALQFFNDLRNEYPSDTRVLMGRAVTLQRLGQNAEALQGYEDVLVNDPKNLDALTNMLGLIKQQNPQLALEKLQDLRNLYPYSADITTQLAVAYGQTGNLNEALRYITLAEALKPESAYVQYNKAVLYDRLGRGAEAADMYRQLIRRAADGTLDQNLPIESIKKRLAVIR